jgi:hypothetical protein
METMAEKKQEDQAKTPMEDESATGATKTPATPPEMTKDGEVDRNRKAPKN